MEVHKRKVVLQQGSELVGRRVVIRPNKYWTNNHGRMKNDLDRTGKKRQKRVVKQEAQDYEEEEEEEEGKLINAEANKQAVCVCSLTKPTRYQKKHAVPAPLEKEKRQLAEPRT